MCFLIDIFFLVNLFFLINFLHEAALSADQINFLLEYSFFNYFVIKYYKKVKTIITYKTQEFISVIQMLNVLFTYLPTYLSIAMPKISFTQM